QTLVLALNGELTAAEAMAGRCAELTASNGWSLLDTDYDLVLAEILLASAAFDAPRLKRAATLLRAIAPRDPYAQHAAAAADGIRQIVAGDAAGGAATLRTVIGGSWSHLSHRLVRDFALATLADVTLGLGGARRALSMLEGVRVVGGPHRVLRRATGLGAPRAGGRPGGARGDGRMSGPRRRPLSAHPRGGADPSRRRPRATGAHGRRRRPLRGGVRPHARRGRLAGPVRDRAAATARRPVRTPR
ncbi:MAG: hypothetical protein PGN24_12195, partial [Microbacterium arborescens]